MIKYLSLFSGIGGFELGIMRAYEEWHKANCQIGNSLCSDHQPPICIGYSENDKYASQIYNKHFKHKAYGDITKLNAKELPDFGLLVGGFPCQAFSIAGKRRGFDDTRGTLFFEIARVLREKQPRLLLLENVKGLLSHEKGNTFYTIISTLDELGYDCQWQVLNSKNFGVPQNRERVYIVGHLRGTRRPEVFPFRESCTGDDQPTGTEREVQGSRQCTGAIDANYHKGPDGKRTFIKQLNKPKHSNNRIYGTDGISPTLNTAQGGNRQPFIKVNKKGEIKKDQESACTLTGGGHSGGNHSDMDLIISKPHGFNKGGKKKFPNMRFSSIQNEIVNGIRRLTPTECERLQGFPDGWTTHGIDFDKGVHIWRENFHELTPISDTQRYKTLGNAVTTNVIKEIMKRILI